MQNFGHQLAFRLVLFLMLLLSGFYWTAGLVLERSRATSARATMEAQAEMLIARGDAGNWEDLLESFHPPDGAYAWVGPSSQHPAYHPHSIPPQQARADEEALRQWLESNGESRLVHLSQNPARTLYIAGSSQLVVVARPDPTGTNAHLRIAILALAGLGLLGAAAIALWTARPVEALARYAGDVLEGRNVAEPLSDTRELAVVEGALVELERSRRQAAVLLPSSAPSDFPGLSSATELRQALRQRIDQQLPFAAGLVDLSYFQPYNRRAGLKKGDLVLQRMALHLHNVLHEESPDFHLLAHLGADRFTFLVPPTRVEAICSKFLERFGEDLTEFYTPEELAAKEIKVKNRVGTEETFPLLNCVIAVSTNVKRPIHHLVQVESILLEIRNYLKQGGSSAFLLDRRVSGDEDLLRGQGSSPD